MPMPENDSNNGSRSQENWANRTLNQIQNMCTKEQLLHQGHDIKGL